MHENSSPQHDSTKSLSPERGIEVGYENMMVTKVPGWHGIIAWDALLNGMATGLFLAAAVSELAAPAVFNNASASRLVTTKDAPWSASALTAAAGSSPAPTALSTSV